MNILIHLIGYFIIFAAIDYKRAEESKIIPWTKDHILVMLMVLVATLLLEV